MSEQEKKASAIEDDLAGISKSGFELTKIAGLFPVPDLDEEGWSVYDKLREKTAAME